MCILAYGTANDGRQMVNSTTTKGETDRLSSVELILMPLLAAGTNLTHMRKGTIWIRAIDKGRGTKAPRPPYIMPAPTPLGRCEPARAVVRGVHIGQR